MIRKEILKNGMVIVSEEIDYANSVSMGIWVKAGSREETQKNAGISHFLEHMNFKGTEKRTAKELAEVLECKGGNLNAYTTKEYTSYYCQVVEEDMALGLDVLSDLYLHSQFKEEDIKKEINVVIEEINLYEDSPEDLVIDMINGVMWGDNPLAQPILGYEDIVSTYKQQDLLDYRDQHYTPKNTVLAVAGKFNHDELMNEVNKAFGDFNGESCVIEKAIPKCTSGMIKSEKDIMQDHVCLGFPGLSIFHPDYYTLILVNEILGGGASSRLFQTIREDLALSYSVFSFVTSYNDCGMVTVYAGTSNGKGESVAELCFKEIDTLKKHGITADELNKLKSQISGGMRIGLDSIGSRISRLGRNELYYGRNIPISEVVQAINNVTVDDIARVANELLTRENAAVAFLGGKNAR